MLVRVTAGAMEFTGRHTYACCRLLHCKSQLYPQGAAKNRYSISKIKESFDLRPAGQGTGMQNTSIGASGLRRLPQICR